MNGSEWNRMDQWMRWGDGYTVIISRKTGDEDSKNRRGRNLWEIEAVVKITHPKFDDILSGKIDATNIPSLKCPPKLIVTGQPMRSDSPTCIRFICEFTRWWRDEQSTRADSIENATDPREDGERWCAWFEERT